MALHQMALYGSTPIGALGMGWIIQTTSPRAPFVLGSLAALGCAGAVARATRRGVTTHTDGTADPLRATTSL